MIEDYRAIMRETESSLAKKLVNKHALNLKELPYGDSACLYLSKDNWSNRFNADREETIGIFFSIWIAPKLLKKGYFSYNAHALKLRKLPGYKLVSTTFADRFRQTAKSSIKNWPNVSTKYGQQTLFEGRDSAELENFGEKIQSRIEGFVKIHHIIDELLLEYKK